MSEALALVSLAGVWALLVVTPGPNFAVLVQVALGGRRAAVFACALGTATGTLIWAVSAQIGLAALLARYGEIYQVLTWVGAAYLFWLGARALASRPRAADAPRPNPLPPFAAWRRALVVNLSNPKTAAFFVTIFLVVVPAEPSMALRVGAAAIMVTITFGWYVTVGLFLTRPGPAAFHRRIGHWLDRLTGVVMIGFGLRLVLDR